MSITSLSLNFVNTYAAQSAKPAAAAERPAPAAPAEATRCDEQRPAPRQNRLVQAMMLALRELGLGDQAAPAPAAPAAPVATGSAAVAASAQSGGVKIVTTHAASAATSGADTSALTDAPAAAPQAHPAAEPAPTLEAAVQQFAHELFRALRQVGRGGSSDEGAGRVEAEGGHKRHPGQSHRHHGQQGLRGQGYGDMSQRLQALSQTFGAPAAGGAAEPAATTGPVANSAKNPLLEAFSTLFGALKPQSAAVPEMGMADKLRMFLHTLAQAIRPEAMSSIQTPQLGGLVNVTA